MGVRIGMASRVSVPQVKLPNKVWGLWKVCVDTEGAVYEVTLLKSAHPLVDDKWSALLRTWPHRPYTLSGVAVAYCYPIRLEVRPRR